MSPEELTKSLKLEAEKLGFGFTGACPAVSPAGFDHFADWLDSGFAGEMGYLAERKEAYQDPNRVMEGVISILMLGLNYYSVDAAEPAVGTGRVSRYAWGEGDYHDFIHKKLKALKRFCEQQLGDIRVRGVIDTAPLLEREFAQLAGFGWQAKNTMLINKHSGSYFFLAALLIDQELSYDQPHLTSHCGTCTACLDACPTDAFVKPYVLDATRCISYLTIEHRSQIPVEYREQMGDWIFGCDVCQDVCPWNRKAEPTEEASFQPRDNANPLPLRELFFIDDDQFREKFRKTPLWRSKRRGLVRNAAITLGNNPADDNISALQAGLFDNEELIRGASAWALGQHNALLARPILKMRVKLESDEDVQVEIQAALENLNQANN